MQKQILVNINLDRISFHLNLIFIKTINNILALKNLSHIKVFIKISKFIQAINVY